MLPLSLLLAATIDGEAALRHASALAALGPRPWGSPRTHAAAQYVASQLRAAGVSEVRLHEFESHGVRGTNVIGVLPGERPEMVVLGAHHDTAPEAAGAYDDGGGVGVLIEVARALSSERRGNTLVIASWDGEEAWSTGKTTTAGSRAYVRSLGAGARLVVAGLALEMCGWQKGTPVVHPIAYADPLRPGDYVIAPGWVMSAVLSGARAAGEPLGVGDPLLSWVYQPAVRTFRARLYGDDLSFLQAGLPATFTSDSTLTRFYPWYHQPTDTPDKLDRDALARAGRAALGATRGLLEARRAGADRDWLAVFGRVVPAWALWALGFGAAIPGLVKAVRSREGGRVLALRTVQAALLAFALWRHLVPAVFVLALPTALASVRRTPVALLGFVPAALLAAVGAVAFARGFVGGTWLAPWDFAALAAALALAWASRTPAGAGGPRPARKHRHGARRRSGGLPR